MPLWMYTLASYIPDNLECRLNFYDTRHDKLEDITKANVFLFSGINQDYNTLIKSQEFIKKRYPNAKTIIGGPICWSFEQGGFLDKLYNFDHIFIGDGEGEIGEIIRKCFYNESLPRIMHSQGRFPILNSRPLYQPSVEKPFESYYGMVIEVSRGCPFLCEFCDIRIMPDNNRPHNKSASLIVSEIEDALRKGKTQFILACDNFIGDPVWALEVADRILNLVERIGVQPSIYTWLTINLAKDKYLMKKLRQAGFEFLFIGIESFNINSLIETAKVQNSSRILIDDIRTIQSFGFIIVAGFIFGFDTDEEDCFDLTINGMKESGLISGEPSFLTALPGTPLYRRMNLSGRLRMSEESASSISTGGVKYETNIKYLLSKDVLINGFKKFTKEYNAGKFQYARLQSYFDCIRKNDNFIALQSSSDGFGSFGKVLKMIANNPSTLKQLFYRGIKFSISPARVYYAFKGILYVISQKNIPGRSNQLQFWLFTWSNYVLKYSKLTDSDFNIESVPKNFDRNQIIPKNYRETASEPIPDRKIDAQVKATIRGLSSVAGID